MSEDACLAEKGCAWCTSGAVGNFCATAEEAQRLPPAVFSCKASPAAFRRHSSNFQGAEPQ